MNVSIRILLLVSAIVLAGCGKRPRADFDRQVASPSGKLFAHFAGYQPRGTVEGYLTVSFSPQSRERTPEITLGHMLGVRAGWLDDHTFAFVYDQLDQRVFASPIYPTGDVSSMVQIISCNRRYVDCSRIAGRFVPEHSIAVKQFPEGGWPTDLNDR